MTRLLVFLLLLPLTAWAQLSLSTVSNSAETAVGATYDFKSVAAGDTKDVRFRARNSGASKVDISVLSVNGTGFTTPDRPSLPYAIAPGNFLDFNVHFVAGAAAAYSATLQVNTISTLLLASSVAATVVTSVSGCTGPDPTTRTIDFGKIHIGQTGTCTISLSKISTLLVTGTGFQGPANAQTVTFPITFTPTTATFFNGVLTVNTQTFPLTGTGLSPPIPAPILEFDGPPQSSVQLTMTMRLPSPAPFDVNGSVSYSFQPDTTLVTDDPTVGFLSLGKKPMPFGIKQGATKATLNGQAAGTFQTGTTSGRIRFTVTTDAQLTGDPTTLFTIPPATVTFDSATGSRRTNDLDVQLIGYDNTYSAGRMSFTFFDAAGHSLDAGTFQADFSTDFRTYFTKSQAGSTFLLLVTFPVTGDAKQIGAVDVQMTNAAGPTATQHLVFK